MPDDRNPHDPTDKWIVTTPSWASSNPPKLKIKRSVLLADLDRVTKDLNAYKAGNKRLVKEIEELRDEVAEWEQLGERAKALIKTLQDQNISLKSALEFPSEAERLKTLENDKLHARLDSIKNLADEAL